MRASYIQMSSYNIREFPVNQMQSREVRSAVKHTIHSLRPMLHTLIQMLCTDTQKFQVWEKKKKLAL